MESPGARRMQRTRERRRNGTICVEPFPVGGHTLAALVSTGLLRENASTDRAAISAAAIKAIDVGLVALAKLGNEESPAEAADTCKDTATAQAEEAERRPEAEIAEPKAPKKDALYFLCELIVMRNVARHRGPP